MNSIHAISYNLGDRECQHGGYWTEHNPSDKKGDMDKPREEFFKKLLEEKGVSQAEAAQAIGMSQANLSKFIHSKPESRSKFIYEISEYFGLTPRECLEGRRLFPEREKTTSPRPHRYSVISWVHAGELHEIEEHISGKIVEDVVYTVKDYGERVIALKVVGDSMEPEFHSGEIIIVSGDSEWKSGDYVVARNINSNVATFKKYVCESGRHLLLPLNRQYDKIEMDHDWTILGKVMQASREY